MRPIKAILATALLAGSASTALAIPYASGITVGSTSVNTNTGTTISYTLNQAAATATIDILNSSSSVIATFPGTTTVGVNTVSWNGRVDNASGAVVATGTGNRVRVSTTGTEAAGWVRTKANGSTGSGHIEDQDAVLNWFPKGLSVGTDPNGDFFGSAMVSFGYGGGSFGGTLLNAAAIMEFRADLEIKAGDNGLASRVLKHPGDDGVSPSPATYTVWGSSWDSSDPNRLWYCGQAPSSGKNDTGVVTANTGAKEYMSGVATSGVLPAFASDVDPTNVIANALLPRTLGIHEYAGTKYAFICRGNGIIDVAAINGSNQFATAVGNILAAEFGTATRYSKSVDFDAAGNLYWTTNRRSLTAATDDGRVYRWDAATVQAAIADRVTNPLTTANASWIVVNNLATRQRVPCTGIAPNGDVFVMSGEHGVYNVGNASTATLNVNLSDLTVLIPRNQIRSGAAVNDASGEMVFDAAGNLIVVDGGNENIIAFSPGGASSKAFTAPPSQSFDLSPFAKVEGWQIMKD